MRGMFCMSHIENDFQEKEKEFQEKDEQKNLHPKQAFEQLANNPYEVHWSKKSPRQKYDRKPSTMEHY